jgi:tight adherence protein B
MSATFSLVIGLFCFLFFLGVFLLVTRYWDSSKDNDRALERLSAFVGNDLDITSDPQSFLSNKQKGVEKALQKYLGSLKSDNWLQLRLYQSGLEITMIQLFLAEIALIAFLTLVFFSRVNFPLLLSFGMAIGMAFFLTSFVINFLTTKRHQKFIEYLPLALDIIMRSIRAGHPLERTLPMVAKEVPDPVGREFRTITEQLSVGVTFEDAFRNAAMRVDLRDFHFFVSALIIQRQTGGSLSEILETIIFVLHKRGEIRAKALALSAEGRLTGMILGALPVLFWFAMVLFKPEYLEFFSQPEGRKPFYTAVGLIVAQVLTVRWLVNIKVD